MQKINIAKKKKYVYVQQIFRWMNTNMKIISSEIIAIVIIMNKFQNS